MAERHREATADLLKGSAAALMIQVHIVELLAQPAILDGWLGKISLLLGGPPVAPVFLTVMGYFVARSRHRPTAILRRGGILLVWAFLLNLGLNAHLLWKINRGDFALGPWEYVLGVDILFSAGLALVIISVARPVLADRPWAWMLAAMVLVLLTPAADRLLTTDRMLKWVAAFVAGKYWWSYFPILPWLAYPLLGIAVGLTRNRRPFDSLLRMPLLSLQIDGLLVLTAAFTIVATGLPWVLTIAHDLPDYYHHDARFFLWFLAFLILWTRMHIFAERYLGGSCVLRWLKWIGRNVTTIYVFQWLLIGNLATALYKTQTLSQCLLWLVGMLLSCSLLTRWAERARLPFSSVVSRSSCPPRCVRCRRVIRRGRGPTAKLVISGYRRLFGRGRGYSGSAAFRRRTTVDRFQTP